MNKFFNADGLVLSSSYAETMERLVFPYLKKLEKDTTVAGADQKPLFCSTYTVDRPQGTVLLIHGFTENAFKFSELVYSLLQNGFNVVAYDQRGHGRSWHLEKIKDTSLVHVDHFMNYVRDMEIIVDSVVSKQPKPWLLFSHSMGGAVSGLYLESHPDVFSRAAFCAPMIQANLGNMSAGVVKFLCQSAKLIGMGSGRVFVSKPYDGKETFENSVATGRERFDWYESIRSRRKEFQSNGPSYSWTLESVGVTAKLLASGEPEKIACPVRLYTAELDHTVLPEAQEKFISRIKKGTHVTVKGAKHEIYRSDDEVLFSWWHDVLEFLKGNNQ
ncbi:MAG: alpha/beta hydrolase [Clostridia bacterium]|nr:alpha/beta hydrolase [Clostridia bacterium]